MFITNLVRLSTFISISALSLPWSVLAAVQISRLPLNNGQLQLNVGEFRGDAEPAADILFFHGYGDRFANHEPLFNEWTRAGFRVIAFDLPSHGATRTEAYDLDYLSFTDLAEIAAQVERTHLEDPKRPLVLAGWSLGGLLATRMVQSQNLAKLSRTVSGLVLYAPGISVYKCVGNWACQITNETLTHDPALSSREIQPRSPIYRLGFATKLLFNAELAWNQPLPASVKTLVVVAGEDEDRYVNSRDLITWVKDERNSFGANIQGLFCPGAFHEVDNELPQYGGPQARAASVEFVRKLLGAGPTTPPSGPCHLF